MEYFKKENGYALIIVLAFIMIASIFTLPYLNNFLHDTREIEIEAAKNQNIYLLESAAQITKALVKENKVMTEDKLGEILTVLDQHSMGLFNSRVTTQLDQENNTITYSNTDDVNKRTNSKLTLTYQTINLAIFDNYPIVIGAKDGVNRISGNHHFKSSYSENTDVIQISKEVYDDLIQQKLELFSDAFQITEQDRYYPQLTLDAEEDIILNNLWVDGSADINADSNKKLDFIILEDMYIGGDLKLDKFENVIIYGDLVVYGDSFDTSNVESIFIGGSLIVNGSIRITGSPELKVGNISTLDLLINTSNVDVFDDRASQKDKDKEKEKDKGNDKKKDETDGNSSEYLDGQLLFEHWKVE